MNDPTRTDTIVILNYNDNCMPQCIHITIVWLIGVSCRVGSGRIGGRLVSSRIVSCRFGSGRAVSGRGVALGQVVSTA